MSVGPISAQIGLLVRGVIIRPVEYIQRTKQLRRMTEEKRGVSFMDLSPWKIARMDGLGKLVSTTMMNYDSFCLNSASDSLNRLANAAILCFTDKIPMHQNDNVQCPGRGGIQ